MSSHKRFSRFLVFKCFWPFNVSFPFFGRTNIVPWLSSFSLEIFVGFSCSLAIFVGFSRSLKKNIIGFTVFRKGYCFAEQAIVFALWGEKGTSFLCFWGLKVGHWSCSCFAFFDTYFSLKKKSSFFFSSFPHFLWTIRVLLIFISLSSGCLIERNLSHWEVFCCFVFVVTLEQSDIVWWLWKVGCFECDRRTK